MSDRKIIFGGPDLTIEDVCSIAATGASVELSAERAFRTRIARSAQHVDETLRRDGVIYGVTTGYGDSVSRAVPEALVAELPLHLTRFHGCGMGRMLTPSETRAVIAARQEGVELPREPANGGKGAAVLAGLALAAERGFSHAVQIDADGQHDIERLGEMLKLAERQPDALVTGAPLYDDTMPLARRIGRWITHLWVSINTHSFRVIDSMCGFRVYPVARTIDVAHSAQVARRMGFDTEILVRMSWSGTPIVTLPVSVTYPPGNHSNFEVWRDNVEISHMHARLFFGMLRRAPGWIFARKQPEQRETPRRWASMGERG
ncbi:aromatic amino acid lyase, partial [Aerococcus mictus]|uniref:aromatic amino acid lyase n=1 Tax=Aerococcus mictus TaxID=2976810 RepID=UPI002FD36DEE